MLQIFSTALVCLQKIRICLIKLRNHGKPVMIVNPNIFAKEWGGGKGCRVDMLGVVNE